MVRRALALGLFLFTFLTCLRGQTVENADKAQVVKLVVVAELDSSGYKPNERVCFSTKEKASVEKKLVSSLRSSKLSIVQLPLCAKRLTRSGIDIESMTLDGSTATVSVSTSDWDWPNGDHLFVYLRKGSYKLSKGKSGSWQIDGYSNSLKDGPQKVPADYKS